MGVRDRGPDYMTRNPTSLRNEVSLETSYSRSFRKEKPGYIKHRISIASAWASKEFPQKINQKGLQKKEKDMFARTQDRWSISSKGTSLPHT